MDHTTAQRFITEYQAAWVSREPGVMATMWHPDGRLVHPALDRPIDGTLVPRNNDATKRLPDFDWQLVRWAASGDYVFIEFRNRATIEGKLLEFTGVDRFRLRDGRIEEEVTYFDSYPLRRARWPDLPDTPLVRAGDL